MGLIRLAVKKENKGCTSIQPNDIDVISKKPLDVEKIVSAFEDFLGEPQPTES